MTTEKAKHLARLFEVIKKYRKREAEPCHWATDEEVKDFLKIFYSRSSTVKYEHGVSKHVAENVIGLIFYGYDRYCYVSAEQVERCMLECNLMSIAPDGTKKYTIKYSPLLKDIEFLVFNYKQLLSDLY